MDAAEFDRTRRAVSIFHQIIDLPEEERATALAAAAEGDDDLRRQVDLLVAADAQAGNFLSRAASDDLPALVDRTLPPPPQRIGRYRLQEEIGRGGMGIVYRVERDDGNFRETVCLKLLKRGMDSEEFLRRFWQERQILAWLRHPSIASLLDGGVAEDGRPFYVMELIDGQPITEYCQARALSTSDRVRLFLQVCRGVQHAHTNLVVHRDLKPSNILVTSRGEVKVLDFGVAKLLDHREGALETQTGGGMLTPQYAAPEQLAGGPITTATDVYALGLLLYEILTGRRPDRMENSGRTGMPPRVLTAELPRPSAVAMPHARGRKLAGDLDNIVLTALRPSPAERYSTAAALEEDLRRYLADRPVRARPPSVSYRARKFVRRHRLGVLSGAVVLLALLGGGAGVLWQVRATRRQAEKATAVTEFMTRLFDVASPSVPKGEGITARTMLDRAAGGIGEQLAEQPEVQAEVMSIIGRFYDRIGAYAEAESLLSRSVELQRQKGQARGERFAESLAWLATVHQRRGAMEEAERLFREALQVASTTLSPGHPTRSARRSDLAIFLRDKGESAEAETIQREILADERRAVPLDREGIAGTLNSLGVILMEKGELDEADRCYREALALRRALYGDTHVVVANTLHNLMVLSRRRGDFRAAEAQAREVLALRSRMLGPDHVDVANTMFNLGAILHSRGATTEAESIYRESIARAAASVGPEHAEVAGMRVSLARLLRERGELIAAERMIRQSLAQIRRQHPDKHPWEAGALLELGRNLRAQGRKAESREALRQSLEIRSARYGAASQPAEEVRTELAASDAGE